MTKKVDIIAAIIIQVINLALAIGFALFIFNLLGVQK